MRSLIDQRAISFGDMPGMADRAMLELHNLYNFDYFAVMFSGTFPAFRFTEHNINPTVYDADFRTSDS